MKGIGVPRGHRANKDGSGINDMTEGVGKAIAHAGKCASHYATLRAPEVDDLVTLGQELLALVARGGLDEANPWRSMDDSSRGLQAIPGPACR